MPRRPHRIRSLGLLDRRDNYLDMLRGLQGAPARPVSVRGQMQPRTEIRRLSQHGTLAHASEQMAREVLASIPLGRLKSELSSELLHVVHSVAYAPDDRFGTLKGKLSFDYALALVRGKHRIEPAQIRQSWAAAPAGLALRTYDSSEIAKIRQHGASFMALPWPTLSTVSGRSQTGKTVFRPANQIPADLNKLCDEVKKMLRQPRHGGALEGALVAAHFKQNFIAIHPYMDGNGRVSRLMAERILHEFGLPAPDWSQGNFDLNLGVEDAALLILQHLPKAPANPAAPGYATVAHLPS
ncbi:hypothetical protein FRC75_13085 [Paracidovorax citrulli]|nr:hypothetical protein CQB05_13195 [Paracidovorax citrulli]UMT84223.1 hypothetical protein FRC75_13085 [Paracidovorax citrulli]